MLLRSEGSKCETGLESLLQRKNKVYDITIYVRGGKRTLIWRYVKDLEFQGKTLCPFELYFTRHFKR